MFCSWKTPSIMIILQGRRTELFNYPDFHFVCGLFFMELVFSDVKKDISYFPWIEISYLKCLAQGKRISMTA